MASQASIRFEHVVKEYQAGRRVVDDVTFGVDGGSFVVLLGPSGCGKTTLLKTVNRLVEPTAGVIFIDGADARSIEPTVLRRNIGYVIQQIGLFPHMTVADNVAVVPSLLGWPVARIAARVEEMLELVHLPAREFAVRYPAALSGGQQQRVGLARALAADPKILLMDEPFGALDAIERTRLQAEVAALQQRLRKTVLFVTHDVDEALHLADAIVILRDGRMLQYDRPLSILAHPADEFVAALVNAQDLVRRFGVMRVSQVALADDALAEAASGQAWTATIDQDSDLRTALSTMLAAGTLRLRVIDARGANVGTLTLERMLSTARSATLT